MTSQNVPKLVTIMLLLHCPGLSFAFGWWFLWPVTSASVATTPTVSSSPIVNQSANGLEIAVGNRENTNAAGNDGGTNITNVEVNYARQLPAHGYAQFYRALQTAGEDATRFISGGGSSAPDGWIEAILEAYFRTANQTQRDSLGTLSEQLLEVEAYGDDVRSMLDRIRIAFGVELNRNLLTLDVAVLRCAQGQAVLDTIATRMFKDNDECIGKHVDRLRHARTEAVRNISSQLVEWDEQKLRNELKLCVENSPVKWNETGDVWATDNEHQLACMSGLLHQVHIKTLLMSHSARELTAGVTAALGTAKADILQCAQDLVVLAQDSLAEISQITSGCQQRLHEERNVPANVTDEHVAAESNFV